jgi:peroxiredoxin
MNRRLPAFGLACMMLVCGSVFVLRSAEKGTAKLGTRAAEFALPDTSGRTVALDRFKDRKAVVVVFIGTECPINNAYMLRLVQLEKSYRARGVQFLAINANQQDTPKRVADHAKEYGLSFPVLKDAGNVVADQFGAQRTPEAFVLDGERIIRYQGRIDDQYGVGYKRPKPIHRDLADALDAMLAGKSVAEPATSAAGCLIARVTKIQTDGQVTFTRHIAHILQKNCQECHRPGQVGPMSLITYDDVVPWADTIREVLQQSRMPPWYADPRYGHFANDRRLPAEDRAALLHWLDHGMPRGDDRDLPPPRRFAQGWTIGEPDLVIQMPEEFDVPADTPKGGVPYQHFRIKTNFKEDRWVSRAEARAGQPSVVHHIIIYVVYPGGRFRPGSPQSPLLVGTAPGDMPFVAPDGFAKKIPAGSELIFEMHYTPNGTATKDRSMVGMIFAKDKPRYNVHTIPVANERFQIPAGADNHKVEQWFPFREDSQLLSFMPHMHLRGKDFLYEIVYPDQKKEILLSVPKYNFDWQSYYRLSEPLKLPKGTRLHCVAHFDNSANNPNNPDPTKAIHWGDQTWDEMMIGWIDFADEGEK